ncbi:MAG: hypothetical protein ABI884_02080 [Gemmatimonadota bacterium]
MNHRLAGATAFAVAAALAGAAACSDSSLAPQKSQLYYASEAKMEILNPVTGVLTSYTPGFHSSTGLSLSTTAPASEPAMLIADDAASVSHVGAAHLKVSTVDATKHKHDILYLYPNSGGPPTAVQHYIDGKLLSETKNTWTRITGGWYRSLMTFQVMNPASGSVLSSRAIQGVYTVATKPCNPKVSPSCGPGQMVINDHVPLAGRLAGYFALGLANVFAPADALAQSSLPGLFGPCTQEWLTYQAAGLALAVAAVALAACPVCGLTEAAFAAALFAAARAEDALLNCELRSTFAGGLGGGSGGDFGAGGSGGAGDFGGCSNGIVTQACVYLDEYTK